MPPPVTDVSVSTASTDPLEQLTALIASSQAKQKRIKQLTANLDGVQRQMEELQNTVEIKKQLIEQMVRNGDARANARARIQEKRGKVEEELCKVKAVFCEKRLLDAPEDCERSCSRGSTGELSASSAIVFSFFLCISNIVFAFFFSFFLQESHFSV